MKTVRERLDEDGFCGPLDSGVDPAVIAAVARRAEAIVDDREHHPLYGRYSVRDWHLVDPNFLRIFTGQEILRAVCSALDEDVLLWRSKIFMKTPGEGPLGWHQEWGAFNGEEIGNDRPALYPASHREHSPWNLTVWIALEDVTPEMGPIRFARGTHRRRFPIEMRPLIESEFYLDPFSDITTKDQLISLTANNGLVLDIDTSTYLMDVDIDSLSLAQLKAMVEEKLHQEQGAVTLEFDESQQQIVSVPMKAGQFVLFSERCMHGSSANLTNSKRLGINARFTFADTRIYPFQETTRPIDGSNIDISHHRSILVSGASRNRDNHAVTLDDLLAEMREQPQPA